MPLEMGGGGRKTREREGRRRMRMLVPLFLTVAVVAKLA